jgi:DNA-binding NtrC family response regulator
MILCDLMMPEISGMDVYETLRLVDPALLDRVVLMTGGAFTTRASKFLSDVDATVIEKPFDRGQLQAIVRAFKQRHEATDPESAASEGEPPSDAMAAWKQV